MAENIIVARPDLVGVFSFTDGFVASRPRAPRTEEEHFRHALWLEKQGYVEEAWRYFKRHCHLR